MNWETFLVNQFSTDYIVAQEKGTKFHYTWLLILIALIGCQELSYYQHIRTIDRGNMVACYANLWHTPNIIRKQDNNFTFYVYFDSIRYIIEHTVRISVETV
jgi:hypothetical protein